MYLTLQFNDELRHNDIEPYDSQLNVWMCLCDDETLTVTKKK